MWSIAQTVALQQQPAQDDDGGDDADGEDDDDDAEPQEGDQVEINLVGNVRASPCLSVARDRRSPV